MNRHRTFADRLIDRHRRLGSPIRRVPTTGLGPRVLVTRVAATKVMDRSVHLRRLHVHHHVAPRPAATPRHVPSALRSAPAATTPTGSHRRREAGLTRLPVVAARPQASRRVEVPVRTAAAAPLRRPMPSPAPVPAAVPERRPAPVTPLALVGRTPARPEPEPTRTPEAHPTPPGVGPPAAPVAAAAAATPVATLAPAEVARITADVLATLDQRLLAHRERTGRGW